MIRKQPDLGVHEPGIGERMRGGGHQRKQAGPEHGAGLRRTVEARAELIADVLRNNDLRAVVSAEMPADGSHSGSLAAPWTQPTGKARQSEILIRQLLAEAGASGHQIVFRFHARGLHLIMGSAA